MSFLKKYYYHFIAVFFNLIYIGVRLPDFYRPIWNDELITLRTTEINPFLNPLYDGVSTNLPLYYYFVKLFSYLFQGENLRITSLLFSIILLNIFIYRYIKEKDILYIITAIFITLSPLQIYYSTELRTYILTELLLIIQFFFIKDFLEGKKVNFYIWGISIFLSLISHYTAYIFVFVSILFIIFSERKISENLLKTYIFPSFLAFLILISVSGNQGFTSSTDESILNLNFSRFSFFNINENFFRLIEVLTIYYNFGLHYYRLDGLFTSLFKKFMYFFFLVPLVWSMIKNRFRNLYLNLILYFLSSVLFVAVIFDMSGFIIFASRYIFPFHFLYILLISFVLKDLYIKSKILFLCIFTIFTLSYLTYSTCLYLNLDIYKGNEDPQGRLIQSCLK